MGEALNLAIALVVVAAIEGYAAWAVWQSLKAVRKAEEEAEELEKKGGNTMDKDNNKKTNAKCVAAAVATMAFMTFAASVTMGFFTACAAREYLEDQEWHEFVQSHIAKLTNKLDQAKAPSTGTDANPLPANDQQIAHSADGVDFAQLDWAYGHFNGKLASPVPECVISDLSVGGGKMSYKWASGGCELLGAADRGDANCIAALFVKGADGAWKGGKFEWISTSRTSRSLGNIEGGYNGWDPNSIGKARGFAFVIVSKDGRRRSNVIVEEK